MLRRPLQQPYDGPFKVLQRKDKVFFLHINGKRVSVSIDRCKPTFFFNTEDLQLPQTKNETPATVEPNATASTPATVEPNATASTPATVESDPIASTPTQRSTRSGRKVHLPTRCSSHPTNFSFLVFNSRDWLGFRTASIPWRKSVNEHFSVRERGESLVSRKNALKSFPILPAAMNWGVFTLCFVSLIAIASCAGKNRRGRTMNTDISFKPEENKDQFFPDASFKKTKRRYRLRIDDSDEDSFQPIRKKYRPRNTGRISGLHAVKTRRPRLKSADLKEMKKNRTASSDPQPPFQGAVPVRGSNGAVPPKEH
ncbi:hypothetical protein TNCV_1486541 [Trichonephila clavipes]|nr:hypothetical protein TNCV_1486541 [Trichonephila clavipes]